ncbi:MAG: hypothetical protein AB7Q01_14655 [Gammaproteobacteria bacterium]
MKIQSYQRQIVEPDSAGGVLRRGAGTPEDAAAGSLAIVGQATGELAAMHQELAARQRAAERATRIDRAALDYKLAITHWLEQRTQDPSQHRTLVTDARDAAYKARQQAFDRMRDDVEAQNVLALRLDEFDAGKAVEVNRIAGAQSAAVARAALQENLAGAAALFARSAEHEQPAILQSVFDTIGAQVHAGSITPEAAQRLHRGFIDEAFGNEISRRIESDPAALLVDLQNGRYAGASERTLVQGERATRDELKRLRAEEERRAAKLEAMRNAQRHEAERAIDRVGRILDAGVAVDPTVLSTARALAAGTGLEVELNAMLVGYQDRARFASLPLADQAAGLRELQARATTEGADEHDVRELRARERIYAAAVQDVKVDPLQAAIDRNLLPQLAPVDVRDPATLVESLQGRRAAAGIAATFAGRPVSVLTRVEAASVAAALNAGTVRDRAGLLDVLRRGLDDVDFAATLAQLSPDSPLPAYAAGLGLQTPGHALFSPGSPSMLVLEGDALVHPPKGEKAFPLPAETDRREEFNATVAGVFDANPEAYRQVRLAADAAYASLSARAGDFSGELDPDRYRDAVQAVTGGVIKVNGKRLVKPHRMTEDQFRDVLDQTTAATVRHLGGVAEYTDEQAAEAIRDGELVNYGPDAYAIRDGGRLLMRADGRGVFTWRPAAAALSRYMGGQP